MATAEQTDKMEKQTKIVGCETYLVDVPVSESVFPFSVSYGKICGLKRVFLKIEAVDQNNKSYLGWGEASPLYPYSNETALSVFELLKMNYGNVLKGCNIKSENKDSVRDSIEQIIGRLGKYLSRERLNFTQNAIDFALYDIGGKIAEVPTYMLLSEREDFTPVGVCWSTSAGNIPKAVADTENYARRGYAIKIKLNGDIDADVDITKRVLETAYSINQKAAIRADANAAYNPVGFAEFCRRVKESVDSKIIQSSGFYVEEPIDTREYGIDEYVNVISTSPFRTMADETLYTVDDAVNLISRTKGCGTLEKLMFNIKVQKVGGLRNAMIVGNMARENNIPIMIGGMFPSSYGKIANCHYAIALGGIMESDGLHPSGDYVDVNNPVITNREQLEVVKDGERITKVFENLRGFGGDINEGILKRHSIKVDLGKYYADFEGFRI
jgi:L-alanine-DL-glutamate epimerase-like enolase superfamily enzyme